MWTLCPDRIQISSDGFVEGEEPENLGRLSGKTLGARTRTNQKTQPPMALGRLQLATLYWWEVGDPITAPALLSILN